MAVKNANFDDLETVMDEGVSVECRDEYGNTLLILSCQQGNKRMAKFLLRRGAQINAQNLDIHQIAPLSTHARHYSSVWWEGSSSH